MNADKNIKLLGLTVFHRLRKTFATANIPISRCIYGNAGKYDVRDTKIGGVFLTPQGQSLVEDVGYVPMDKRCIKQDYNMDIINIFLNAAMPFLSISRLCTISGRGGNYAPSSAMQALIEQVYHIFRRYRCRSNLWFVVNIA